MHNHLRVQSLLFIYDSVGLTLHWPELAKHSKSQSSSSSRVYSNHTRRRQTGRQAEQSQEHMTPCCGPLPLLFLEAFHVLHHDHTLSEWCHYN